MVFFLLRPECARASVLYECVYVCACARPFAARINAHLATCPLPSPSLPQTHLASCTSAVRSSNCCVQVLSGKAYEKSLQSKIIIKKKKKPKTTKTFNEKQQKNLNHYFSNFSLYVMTQMVCACLHSKTCEFDRSEHQFLTRS